MNKTIVMAGLAVAGLVTGANAQWVEGTGGTGDAGGGIAGSLAQFTGATTGLALPSISGTLSAGVGNEDAYVIFISDPSAFSASTVGGTAADTQLFLFFHSGGGVAGLGIAANDDAPASLQSTLPAGNPLLTGLAPGNYVLAVSGFNNDPSSAGGLIFPSSPFGTVFGPVGPGGGSPLASWAGGGSTGAYTIFLTGTSTKAVPGPASLALLGVAGLAARRRRRA